MHAESPGAALEAALAEEGIHARVSADGALAVLVPHDAAVLAALRDDARRERVVTLAREYGFTHVAVELPASS